VLPDHVVLPMNGWDESGYRLGYGAGYFDRTLASLRRKPLVIGVSYELARMPTIHAQSWDIPMDWVVTERGRYRREPAGLAFAGA
jgi:5,10-methenyltetrahydrofolate synthetase